MYKGLIFTADIHLRPDTPVCRTDDFLESQWRKLRQVQQIARRHNLAWIDGGDVFHKAQPPLAFVNDVLGELTEPIYAGVMGNHDLPAHNIGRMPESAWGTLYVSGWLKHEISSEPIHIDVSDHLVAEIYGVNYGERIPEPYEPDNHTFKILIMHDMVYASKADTIPNAPGSLAKKLLRDNKGYDLIITGHNHQSFMVEVHGRHLVNIGSLTRQTADQADHTPRILTWIPGTTTSGLQWHTLEFERDVVSREHIEKKQQKEQEDSAFVLSLQQVDEVSLSFQDNVEAVLQQAQPDKPVEEKVREAME